MKPSGERMLMRKYGSENDRIGIEARSSQPILQES